MYGSTEGRMSVSARMANISFPTFLRDQMNNQTSPPYPVDRTRAPNPLRLQTINTWQTPLGAYCGSKIRPPPFRNPDHRAAYPVPHPMMTASGFFKDHVRRPDDLYLSGELATGPSGFRQDASSFSSLWPTVPYPYHATTASPNIPLKTETTPQLPVPSVLHGEVDASKYEGLSYDEWSRAPTLYNSSSPASSVYHADSPATPSDAFSNFTYNLHSDFNQPAPKPDALAFQAVSHDLQQIGYPPTLAPSALAYSMMYEVPHGLPAANHNLYYPTYEHLARTQSYNHHLAGASPPREVFEAMEAQSDTNEDTDDDESSDTASTDKYRLAEDEADARDQRDELLLRMRGEGHSYREIKRIGKFREAESTLRGRHRTLTKDKEERVRKPQWTDDDEVLLRRAVKHYMHAPNHRGKVKNGRRKLPWKKISQRMKDHGSSYLFAPATCARKWESLSR